MGKPFSKKGSERHSRLLPNGEPKYVRCYDNKGLTADRYIVVFSHQKTGFCHSISCSENPCSPQGVWNYDETRTFFDTNKWGFAPAIGRKAPSANIGWRIPYSELPKAVQKEVLSAYCELWNLEL